MRTKSMNYRLFAFNQEYLFKTFKKKELEFKMHDSYFKKDKNERMFLTKNTAPEMRYTELFCDK